MGDQGEHPLRSLLLAIDGVILSRIVYQVLEYRWKRKHLMNSISKEPEKKPIRVWVDGVFDMMHFGHANMLRQAKALGDYLIVGVNSDSTVREQKGTAPVMTDEERFIAVQATRWVDEVIMGTPYVMSPEYIEEITKKYGIDIFVHGDDECFDAQGNDVYAQVKKEGRFRTVKRTEGVSSTELVGRMLLMTTDHHRQTSIEKLKRGDDQDEPSISSFKTRSSHFLPTTRRISQFSRGKAPKPTDKIVYIDGSWDMFHAGHIKILEEAKKLGDFLLVGICDDETINKHRGSNWPIMNLHERTLCVLSCRYVDEVIIGAPWAVTQDMITTMNISLVVHGKMHDKTHKVDPYEVPKRLGIHKEIDSPLNLTTRDIVDRILKQKEQYEKRYEGKAKKEEIYLKTKKYVAEI